MMFGPTHPQFNHVGIAVLNILNAGIPTVKPILDPIKKVFVAFANLHGCPVELIEPSEADSPIAKSIQENRKLVHLCFEVDELGVALAFARKNGFLVVHDPVQAVAFQKRRIAWLYHTTLGLIELLERKVAV